MDASNISLIFMGLVLIASSVKANESSSNLLTLVEKLVKAKRERFHTNDNTAGDDFKKNGNTAGYDFKKNGNGDGNNHNRVGGGNNHNRVGDENNHNRVGDENNHNRVGDENNRNDDHKHNDDQTSMEDKLRHWLIVLKRLKKGGTRSTTAAPTISITIDPEVILKKLFGMADHPPTFSFDIPMEEMGAAHSLPSDDPQDLVRKIWYQIWSPVDGEYSKTSRTGKPGVPGPPGPLRVPGPRGVAGLRG